MKKHILALIVAIMFAPVAANAHTVTVGWTDNGDGTVTIWNETWHGDQPFPCFEGVLCSANGGLTISGDGSGSDESYGLNAFTVQWAGTLNNTNRDDMIADGTLLGYQDDPGNAGGGTYNDWLFTAPLVLGDGIWWLFTGTNCCIDTMTHPIAIAFSGISSVPEGTGPGGVNEVPIPAAAWLFGTAIAGAGAMMRRRKANAKAA